MFYNSIAFILTNKCNAECSFCCFSCCPQNKDVIDLNIIKKVQNELKNFNSIKHIGFSGGEPFLYEDLLLQSIALFNNSKYKISCNTNCFRFKSYSYTEQLLTEAKMNGLTSLNISVDEEHSRYIEWDCIKNALKVANKINLVTTLRVGMYKQFESDFFAKLISYLGEYIFPPYIQIYPYIPLGRASTISRDKFISGSKSEELKCPHYYSLTIMPNGNIYPCCSGILAEAFCCGNINNILLRDAIINSRNNTILKSIFLKDFKRIVPIIKEKKLFQLKNEYITACDLCNDLFSHTKEVNTLCKYLSGEKNELKTVKVQL